MLAVEIDARAGRLANAKDDQFVLATDNVIRWQGQPVGKLIAAEEALKPRVRIIADEQLTGAPRDQVQARLDLWLKTHIGKLLGPLFQLANAEELTGLARGIGFQLAEALGVIDRVKIANEVKSLDQPARASLRKYGVRFGAYHIYVPALLKPAPRVLATQLYALKHEGPECKGLDTIQQIAASGRTSIVADKEIARDLYRIAGFRVCGERAVRVDILERLADIIRPALAWRAGSPIPRPAAAADRFGFVVTTAMTSLAGCSGDDFASVLRALGYRMERRPKPPPEPPAVVEASAVEAAPADAAMPETATSDAATPDVPTPEAPMTDAAAVDVTPLVAEAATEVAAAAPPEAMAPAEPVEVVDAAAPIDIVDAEPVAAASEPAPEPIAPSAEDVASSPAEQAPEHAAETKGAAEEQQFIEVWRPGRPEGERRPRRPRPERRPRREPRRPEQAPQAATPADGAAVAADATAAAPASAAGASAVDGAPGAEPRKPWRRGDDRKGRDEARRSDRPDHGARPQRPDRPDHAQRVERGGRSRRDERGERGERGPRGDRPDRDPELRAKYIKGREERAGRGRREQQQPDPNSPFAKLAALKAQLESNKEPS